MLKILACIGLGSFLGGIARYGVGKAVVALAGVPTIWGTFAANMLGCLLIGLFSGLFDRYDFGGQHWRMFLTVGFCGGFTTFSTFINENYLSMSQGRFFEMVIYASLSFALVLALVYAGHSLVCK